MNVTITARRCTLPDPVLRRTNDRIQKLARFEPRIIAAEVVYEFEHGVHKAEARVTIAGRPPAVARAEHQGSCGAALDRMVERLARRLRRGRKRRTDHRATPTAEAFAHAGAM